MPFLETKRIVGGLISLGGSHLQTFDDGTSFDSNTLDCRDLGAIGYNDFASAVPAQIWIITWSFLVISPVVSTVPVETGLYLNIQQLSSSGPGAWSIANGPVVMLPFSAGIHKVGEVRIHADAALVQFANNCGTDLTIAWHANGKAF